MAFETATPGTPGNWNTKFAVSPAPRGPPLHVLCSSDNRGGMKRRDKEIMKQPSEDPSSGGIPALLKIPGFSPLLGSLLGCFIISLSRRFIPPRLSDEHSSTNTQAACRYAYTRMCTYSVYIRCCWPRPRSRCVNHSARQAAWNSYKWR